MRNDLEVLSQLGEDLEEAGSAAVGMERRARRGNDSHGRRVGDGDWGSGGAGMGGGKDILAGDQKAPWQLCVSPGPVKERNPRGKAD